MARDAVRRRREGSAVPRREGTPGQLGLGRTQRGALPGTPLLTSSNYVPIEYVAAAARRRSRQRQRASPATATSTSRRPAAAYGARRTRSMASPTGSTWADRSASTPPAPSPSTRTTRAATPSTSAPARRTSAVPAASPAPASTSRPTAATPGRTARRSEFDGLGVGAIVVKPDARHDLRRARRPRCAACRRSAARASRGRSPAPGNGACTSRRTAARPGPSSTTAPRRPATAPAT